jgi:hypothetical protein
MAAWHFTPGNWMVMLHGELKAGLNYQGGPRGVGKVQSQNWAMAMGERSLGSGRLLLRGMFSAEPLTAPHGGFPQLFQTGESYRGRPIIDAQHPHDVVMELAASYTIPITENVALQIYGGPVGSGSRRLDPWRSCTGRLQSKTRLLLLATTGRIRLTLPTE